MSSSTPVSGGDHFFEADGVRFHYLVRGSGPLAIMQVVGWGAGSNVYINHFGPQLEQQNTVVYFEPRGNGQSSRPDDAQTMCARVMAEDLEHLRAHLGVKAFSVLVGSSHAGLIALRYAEQHPNCVSKLVLLASQTQDGPPQTNMQDWAAKRADDPAYKGAYECFKTMGQSLDGTDEKFREVLWQLLPIYLSKPELAGQARQAMEKGPGLPQAWSIQTNANDSKPENKLPNVTEAGKVTAKTLIIWGEEDALCSLQAARALEAGIKGSRLVLIPGAGHFAWLDKPDEFWGPLKEFMKD